MTPTAGTTPRPSLVNDLYRRLNESGPMVTITKAQAAWLLEMEAIKDIRIEAAEAALTEAVALLSAVRDADVIFAKGDWHISRAIAVFLAAHAASEEGS